MWQRESVVAKFRLQEGVKKRAKKKKIKQKENTRKIMEKYFEAFLFSKARRLENRSIRFVFSVFGERSQ